MPNKMVNGQLVEMSAAEVAAMQADRDAIAARASIANSIEERRKTATISRLDFCKALWRQSILPPLEAAAASRGEWPATFSAFTAGKSDGEIADLMIEWAAASTIHYSHQTLQDLALVVTSGDQAQATVVLDQIFGITP